MYCKSILRSLVIDGGVSITDPARLRDLLHEQAQLSQQVNQFGTIGGGIAIGLGLMMMSINPGSLLATLAGAYALYLGQRNKPTTTEEKEFRFLSRHGQIINLMGEFAKTGNGTADEILSAYESLTRSYLPITDQIVLDGEPIAAGEMMAQLPQVIAAQREPSERPSPPLIQPATRKSMFPPSRLSEYAERPSPSLMQPAAPNLQSSPVALLERTLTQEAAIGLPSALMEVTIKKPYSTFIFGQSEAGKDITLYSIIQALKAKHPTAYFLGIDGKNHAPERPLWDLYDDALHISMRDQPIDYHNSLIRLLDKALDFPAIAFIGFSELNGIAAAYSTSGLAEEWREVAHRIAYLAIQGNAAGKYIYATAQALNLDSLGLKKESRANCHFIAIANSTQFGFLSQIVGDTKVFNSTVTLNQLAFQSACSRSTATQHLTTHNIIKGIAYFHTALNRWEPMPRLVNPGVDRCAPAMPEVMPAIQLPPIAERPSPQTTAPDEGKHPFQLKAELAESCILKIRDLNGSKTTFAKLKKTLSRAQLALCDAEFEELLMDDDRIGCQTEAMRNGMTTIRLWWEGDET